MVGKVDEVVKTVLLPVLGMAYNIQSIIPKIMSLAV